VQAEKRTFSETAGRLDSVKGSLRVQWNELAGQLGVTEQYLRRVRKGLQEFSPPKLRRLLELERESGLVPDLASPAQVREASADYPEPPPDNGMQVCRFPEDCDLVGRVEAMEGNLGDVLGEIRLIRASLTRLLEAGERAPASGGRAHGHQEQIAG